MIKCKYVVEEDLKGNIDRDYYLECLFLIKVDVFEIFLFGCFWYCKWFNYGGLILVIVKFDVF